MTSLSRVALLAASASFLALPAMAQANLLTAPKLACPILSVTTCTAPGKCTTEPGEAGDKADMFIFDFAGKAVLLRKDGKTEKLLDILNDKVSGEVRNIVLGEASKPDDTVPATLGNDGKLVVLFDKDGSKAEATCKIGS